MEKTEYLQDKILSLCGITSENTKTITLRIRYHLKLAPTHLLMPESGKAALCACALHFIARASPCSFVWSTRSIAVSFQPPGSINSSEWGVHQYFIKRKRVGTTWFASLWSVNSCTAYAEWSLQPGNANVVLASTRDCGLVVSNTLHNCVLCGGSLRLDLSRPVRACDMMNTCSKFGPSKSPEATVGRSQVFIPTRAGFLSPYYLV